MTLKLGMKHQGMELCKVCINHDPGMTLTYFYCKAVKMSLKRKMSKKWENGQNIYDSGKK